MMKHHSSLGGIAGLLTVVRWISGWVAEKPVQPVNDRYPSTPLMRIGNPEEYPSFKEGFISHQQLWYGSKSRDGNSAILSSFL